MILNDALMGVILLANRKINSKKRVVEPVLLDFNDDGELELEADYSSHALISSTSIIDGYYVPILSSRYNGELTNTDKNGSITVWRANTKDIEKRIEKVDTEIESLYAKKQMLEYAKEKIEKQG